MTYFLFGVIAFGGSHSGGGETPVSIQLVIEQVAEIIFKKNLLALLFIGEILRRVSFVFRRFL
jgi:hypothetical protein